MREEEISRKLKQQMTEVHLPPVLRARTLMRIEGKEENEMKKKIAFTPVLACIILALSVCTALAAGFFWNHSLENKLGIDDFNRNRYEQSGLLENYDLTETHDGITVSLDQCVVDENTAYIAFRVDGFVIEANDEPGFDVDMCSTGLNGTCSICSGFNAAWDSETDAEIYADDNGTLIYGIYITAHEESLIGRNIHVELGDLGIYKKDKSLMIDVKVHEKWTFDWTLSGSVETTSILGIDKPIGETGWLLDSVIISPITAKVRVTSTEGTVEDDYPYLSCIVMSDGSEYYMEGGGSEKKDEYCFEETLSLNRVIDISADVKAVRFYLESYGTLTVELD